jgi:mannosyltransferase OCH1-like enzyme
MKANIPKIIHQIWSGIDEPLPVVFKELGETWKRDYPDWEYIQWDNKMMVDFVMKYYPRHWDIYNKFPYNVQRWDAIRYLILDKLGGMYVDFDYESLMPMDELFHDKSCCFAVEPESHRKVFRREVNEVFNNALMASVREHPFMKKTIDKIFSPQMLNYQGTKNLCVLNTTGPWLLMDLYYDSTDKEKEDIYLIPDKYVTPFDFNQAHRFRVGEISRELENCVQEAFAVHYFFSNWRNDDK